MTGVKGRSGKTSDPKARRQRALAGQKGGRSSGGGTYSGGSGGFDSGPDPIDPERMPPDPGAGFLDLLPGSNPYDKVVTKTKGRFGYLDAKAREQSNGELLANEKRQQDLAVARGKLLTREQHRAAVASVVTAIIEASSTLTTAAVSLHAPEQQPVAQHQFEAALSKWRESAMALIKGESK